MAGFEQVVGRTVAVAMGSAALLGCRPPPEIRYLSGPATTSSSSGGDAAGDDAATEPADLSDGSGTAPGSDPGDDGSSPSGSESGDASTSSDDEDPQPPPDVAFGLEARPDNPNCVAWSRPTGASADPFPRLLSRTGCFEPGDPSTPASGLIPYGVNSPLWSDGAVKSRWMAIPDGETIAVDADGDFVFPVGTVLIKRFALEDRPIETRLMMLHDDGDWAGYSYAWRDDGSDAELLDTAVIRRFGTQEWTFPSRENCLDCHREVVGRAIGPEVAQLDRPFVYPRGRADQLATLEEIGLLTGPLPDADTVPRLPSPSDETFDLETRVRAYWHGNCAYCHRPDGVDETTIDLRYDTPLSEMRICGVNPSRGAFGIPQARLLSPGAPERSLVSIRMGSTIVSVRMPQIGTALVDEPVADLVDRWIEQLEDCP